MEKEQLDHQKEKTAKDSRIIVLVVVMIVGGVLFLLSFVPALLWFMGNYDSNTPAQFTPTPSPVPALSRTLDSDTFPDEAFRKYLSENVDLNGDGGLDVLEYEEVTELHLNGLGIKNLEGISKFYYLKVLECKDNELTTLDVTHNPRLITLDCSNNQITELDLSRSTRLKDLTVDPDVKVIRSEDDVD